MKQNDNRRRFAAVAALALAAGLLSTVPGRANADMSANGDEANAAKYWETGSSVYWMRRSIDLFRARGGVFGRINAYLSLAQYRAVLSARDDDSGPPHPSVRAAAAGASVVVLSFFYPLDAAALEAEIHAQRSATSWPGEQQRDFAAGEAIGRRVGAEVLVEAAADNFGQTPPGTPPGAGYWYSSGAPIVRGGLGARTFHLTHDGEILAPPPPPVGSAAFLAALAEVRAISDNRTPEQDAIARKWVPFSGVLMNVKATDLIVKHRRGEIEAARILAYANTAAFDAITACFRSKFTYWYLRPSQYDPAIVPPSGLGLPNHPSYPSAHSCESGAFQGVLSAAFPSERDALAAFAAEANISRIYAGFHYLFDGNAGLALGREAARIALERDALE